MRRHLSLLFGLGLALASPGYASADIRIGFANPLSGPYALSGARNRIATEMAVRDLNANGGLLGDDVTLVEVDDACGLQRSVEAARELVRADVRAVIGHFCSHSSLLAAGIYETADILMITPSSTHPRLTEEGRLNVFRLNGRDDRQGELAGNFLADHWGDARIAILHDGSTYGEGLAIEARKQLRVRGVAETIYQLYPPDADDYTDLVDQLRAAEIDVVYVGGYGPDAGRILRAARERGDALRLVGGDGVGMDEFWTVADRAGEGTIFSGQRDPSTLPEAVDVLAQFRARGLGTRSGGLAYYAAVEVWAQAVARAQTVKLAAVADMLRAKRFTSVLGPVAFDSKGDLRGAGWQWKVWTKGNHVPLTRVEMTQ